MPRNGSGTMSIPTTFVANTPALAADVNTNFTDVATALTGSLAIDGQSAMTGQLKAVDGSITAPGFSFASDLNTGFYRSASGVIRATCDGTNSLTVTAAGVTVTGALTATSLAITGGGTIPSGGIIMWSGSVASIPSGWVICDGTNSTPDLRDKFVIGAGSTYAVAATGGSANAIVVSHTHTATVTDAGHTHVTTFETDTGIAGGGSREALMDDSNGTNNATETYTSASSTTGVTVANSTEGSSGTNANLPPYYALAFIMKT